MCIKWLDLCQMYVNWGMSKWVPISKTICLAHWVGGPTNLHRGENIINYNFSHGYSSYIWFQK